MYLHRYPHIQSTQPYINRHGSAHTQTVHEPPEKLFLVVKSQLFSRHYNLRSAKITDVGLH